MTRDKKILVVFISYLLLGILICLIGLSNVFASTYNASQFTAQLYDNYGPALHSVTTDFTNNRYQGIIPTMVANSSGGAWGISSPVTLVANHTYALTADITGTYGGKLVLSTYNRIGVGTTLNNAKTSYQNNTNSKEIYSKVQDNGYTIQFAFTPTISASYIVFPFATNYSGDIQTFYLENIVIDDLGSESLTEEQISNSLNSQTNELNNSINNMGDDIKDSIKDTFESCRPSKNLFPLPESQTLNGITYTKNSDGTFNIVGTASSYTEFSVWKNYNDVNIDLSNNDYYFLSNNTSANQNLVYQISTWNGTTSSPSWVNTPYQSALSGLVNTGYNNVGTLIRFTLAIDSGKSVNYQNVKVMLSESSTALNWEAYGVEICQNKIDETNDKIDETNNQLGDLNNNITNDNIDNNKVSNAFNDFENFIDENATISTLLTLPVTLFSSILNGLQNTCSPFNLGSLYGEDLILPCINLSSYLGSSLWTMIDIIISGFAIYFISQKFIKVFNNFSSMKEGDVIDD